MTARARLLPLALTAILMAHGPSAEAADSLRLTRTGAGEPGSGRAASGPDWDRMHETHRPRGGHRDHRDHRRARDARRRGEAMPLAELMPEIERRHGGRIIGVAMEQRPVLAYRFRLLDAEGRVRDLRVDARDGSPLGWEID